MNKLRILHISPNFNYSCGVSKHIFLLLKNFSNSNLVEFHFITNGGDSLKRLNELDISFKIIKFSTGIKNIFYFFSAFYQIRKYCIHNNINIIHTHHRFPEFLAFIISKTLKIKTVTTAHSFVNNYKIISYKGDKIIAVSDFVKEVVEKSFNIKKNKIVTLNNFVEPLRLYNSEKIKEIKNKFNISPQDNVLLFVGRISYIKGVDILIEVFQKLKSEYCNLKLLLVGEMQDDFEIDNNLIKIIEPQMDIENYYQLAGIIILPTRMDAFPYTMLEAALAEKVLIASNVGGIPEFIKNNYNGLLFNIDSPVELLNATRNVLINEKLRNTLIKNNTQCVKKYLDKEKYFRELLKVYQSLLY